MSICSADLGKFNYLQGTPKGGYRYGKEESRRQEAGQEKEEVTPVTFFPYP